MQELLFKVMIQLRAMQLYAHNAHLLAARAPFFADHEALGAFYASHTAEFDSVAERMIGSGMDSSLAMVPMISAIQEKIGQLPSLNVAENKVYFSELLKMERELQQMIKIVCNDPGCSEGTKQLIGGIADMSEGRCYKISRRIK